MDLLVIILIAFLVSVLFSILGLGGAIIYTPLFFWLGVPLLTAIPMALLLNAITTASASITYFRQHIVDLKIGPPIIFTSILGTIVGSYMASRVDTKILVLMFSVILVIAALRLLFFNTIKSSINGTEKYLIGTVGGFLIGVISSLLGIGGGTFVVPMLMVFFWIPGALRLWTAATRFKFCGLCRNSRIHRRAGRFDPVFQTHILKDDRKNVRCCSINYCSQITYKLILLQFY
jgi:uncharacterized membrane protein YfcA